MNAATNQTETVLGPQHPSATEAAVIRVLHGCMTLVLAVATVYLANS